MVNLVIPDNAVRGNSDGTVFASAVYAATPASVVVPNYYSQGIIVLFDVTAVPGSDTVSLTIQMKNPTGGAAYTILTGAALSTTGLRRYIVYPGVTTSANVAVSEPAPSQIVIGVTHSAGSNFTYSVGYALID